MTNDELRLSLEEDLTWRKEEIFFFKNQLNNFHVDTEKDRYRKSMVVILYSHLEGFTKICLLSYVQFLNSLELKRNEVCSNLKAASMEKEFKAYDSNDAKCKIFKKQLPEDVKLHKLYRRVHLLDEMNNFQNKTLIIDDETIDTESNLWYIVLQKNLYKMGLPVDLFIDYKGDIDGLVNRRNSLAHGAAKAGIVQQEYQNWENKILRVMENMIITIYNYAVNEKYLSENTDNTEADL